jgi:hypothetical protein
MSPDVGAGGWRRKGKCHFKALVSPSVFFNGLTRDVDNVDSTSSSLAYDWEFDGFGETSEGSAAFDLCLPEPRRAGFDYAGGEHADHCLSVRSVWTPLGKHVAFY